MTDRFSPTVAILSTLMICAIVFQIRSALSWGHGSYQITDWLINYSGGFVRRGLPGEIIGWLSQVTHIAPNHLVILVSLILFLALAIWFLRKSGDTFPTALILSCIVIGFPAYQDSIIRKDCLGLLLLLACLKVEDRGLPKMAFALIVNVLAALAILSHETFVFFALPALVMLHKTGSPEYSLKDLLLRSSVLAPAILIFLLVVKFHGTPAIANAVHESWMPLWHTLAPEQSVIEPAASIAALGWTTEQGVYLSQYILTSGLYQPLAWVTVFTVSFVLVLLFTGRNESAPTQVQKKVRITALLVTQFVFISPLFLLGVDYGRWLFLWIASSLMLHICGRHAPRWIESAVSKIFTRFKIPEYLERIPTNEWYFLFFGVPVIWNLHNFMVASPVVRHLDLLRSYF